MSHVRTQIRSQVVDDIKTGATSFLGNVVSSRVYPFIDADMPSCNVLIDSEEVLHDTMCPGLVNRTAILSTEIYSRGTDLIDDVLDDLCVEVENVLDHQDIGGLVASCTLASSAFAYSGEGDQPIATAILQWQINYFTPVGDPETAAG